MAPGTGTCKSVQKSVTLTSEAVAVHSSFNSRGQLSAQQLLDQALKRKRKKEKKNLFTEHFLLKLMLHIASDTV